MVRTQVQLTKKQASDLRRLAVEKGTSVAELIRQGVEQILSQRRGPDRETLRRRALAIIGKFDLGVSDASTNHDEYFVQSVEGDGEEA